MLSPDGQTLAFTGIAQEGIFAVLYVKEATAGSLLRQITPAEQEDQLRDCSPDGNKIAFSSHCCDPQKQEIWTMNSDGSGLRRLTNNRTNYFAARP
jgi:Tol biopolymer transport system component